MLQPHVDALKLALVTLFPRSDFAAVTLERFAQRGARGLVGHCGAAADRGLGVLDPFFRIGLAGKSFAQMWKTAHANLCAITARPVTILALLNARRFALFSG